MSPQLDVPRSPSSSISGDEVPVTDAAATSARPVGHSLSGSYAHDRGFPAPQARQAKRVHADNETGDDATTVSTIRDVRTLAVPRRARGRTPLTINVPMEAPTGEGDDAGRPSRAAANPHSPSGGGSMRREDDSESAKRRVRAKIVDSMTGPAAQGERLHDALIDALGLNLFEEAAFSRALAKNGVTLSSLRGDSNAFRDLKQVIEADSDPNLASALDKLAAVDDAALALALQGVGLAATN